jgi:diketogulonate reductase-like aldo/keto reductase
MKSEPLDFIQINYSLGEQLSAERILPLAQDRGMAVLINRPFQKGRLFSVTRGKSLPAYAKELGCESWAQFFLKYIVSHPAVTCAIPATTKPKHMRDNMQAQFGVLPSASQREQMLATIKAY